MAANEETALAENTNEAPASPGDGQQQQEEQQAGQQSQEQETREEDLSTTERLMRKQAAEREESKDEGGKAASEEQKGEEAKEESSEVAGAPESYEDFQTPEGGVDLGGSVIAGISETAKELDLPQEKAQKIVDAVASGQARQLDELRASWQETAKKDSEIGGTKHDEALSFAKKALKQFGTEDFNALLSDPTAGVGDMPEVIRFMSRIGRAISDDKVITGSPKQVKVPEGRRMANTLFEKSLGSD